MLLRPGARRWCSGCAIAAACQWSAQFSKLTQVEHSWLTEAVQPHSAISRIEQHHSSVRTPDEASKILDIIVLAHRSRGCRKAQEGSRAEKCQKKHQNTEQNLRHSTYMLHALPIWPWHRRRHRLRHGCRHRSRLLFSSSCNDHATETAIRFPYSSIP
jgi:hypothetical protein